MINIAARQGMTSKYYRRMNPNSKYLNKEIRVGTAFITTKKCYPILFFQLLNKGELLCFRTDTYLEIWQRNADTLDGMLVNIPYSEWYGSHKRDISPIKLLWDEFDKRNRKILQEQWANISYIILEKLVPKLDVQNCSSCSSCEKSFH